MFTAAQDRSGSQGRRSINQSELEMQNVIATAKRFVNDEEGATAVEYGIMVALIATAIAVTVTTLGNELIAIFTNVTGAF
jgi:pilus assembly protein Flp/PilA